MDGVGFSFLYILKVEDWEVDRWERQLGSKTLWS